jgi:UDP-N-acetylglucosamine 2-epimerase (non-hydrolysing)
MKIISVVGARPNFMKVAPIYKAIYARRETIEVKSETIDVIEHCELNIEHLICHTGQHYDEKMSKVFFEELELPKPDFYLGVGGGSHAEQTARIMIEFEKVLIAEKPDLVIVVGDVNSTIACSLTAVKLGIKVAHVEAGLRSFDRGMPEEINRILTDSISDYLFVTEKSGIENLKKEGIPDSKVFFVGHVMIDSLIHYLPIVEEKIKEQNKKIKNDTSTPLSMTGRAQRGKRLAENEVKGTDFSPDKPGSKEPAKGFEMTSAESAERYILVTMHRPSNVDDKEKLSELLKMLNRLADKRKVIFPIHPRTKNNIEKFGLSIEISENLIITEPIGYLDFIGLVKNAEVILTDSGGIQEESTYLGVQCVTLRTSTERPITVEIGTNHLVGDNFEEAERVVNEILSGKRKERKIPDLWDGKAAERIVRIIVEG